MLRELNVSIPEIKAFLSNRSAENMEQLLQEKITELNHTIAHLKGIRQALLSRHQDMETIQKIDLSDICIVERKNHISSLFQQQCRQALKRKLRKSLKKPSSTNYIICMMLYMAP